MSMISQLNYGEKASDAVISVCQNYRYALTRVWDADKPYAMFVGLNPSTADAVEDDHTIGRCISYAKSWGYGGLVMANLFAYRTPYPPQMMAVDDPVGPDNDDWLVGLAECAGVVVAAWGNDGQFQQRSDHVRKILPQLHYLKLNLTGQPAHPARLSASLSPIVWDI